MSLTRVVNGQEKYASALYQQTLIAYHECAKISLTMFLTLSPNQIKARGTAAQKCLFYSIKSDTLDDFRIWWDSLSNSEIEKLSEKCRERILHVLTHNEAVLKLLLKPDYGSTATIWNNMV